MSQVKLWIGRAGTGKSERVAKSIADEVKRNPLGGKIFWIVPETVSFAAERRLVEAVHSTVRAEVLSMPRLALRIQNELQVVDESQVNTTGQRLLLAQVLKEAEPRLLLLHRAKPTLSFLDSILDAFEEMSANRVSMERIQSTLQIASTQIDEMDHPLDAHTGRRLLGKLGDLCTLYFLYQRALAKMRLYDPSELMERVHDAMFTSSTLRGATIYIDGFQDMQPRELHFALTLAEVCEETTLVLSGDPLWFQPNSPIFQRNSSASAGLSRLAGDAVSLPNPNDARATSELQSASFSGALLHQSPSLTELMDEVASPGDVYAPQSVRLYRDWMRGCEERGLKPSVLPLSNDGEAGTSPEANSTLQGLPLWTSEPVEGMLTFLERHLNSEQHSKDPWNHRDAVQMSETLRIAAAQNLRAEVEGVAADVLAQVYHHLHTYDDIMVVVPNLSDYTPLLREVFGRNEIPFDLADPPALSTHPLAKFILGALSAVDENLSVNSVLRILKTEFCGLVREDADWFEGYLVRHQIAGLGQWTSPFDYAQRASDRGDDDRMAKSEDERAERLRGVMTTYLLPFVREMMVPECTTRAVAEAVWALLDAVRAKRRMAAWLVDEGSADDPQAASVQEQVWQRILGVLNDLSLYAGESPDDAERSQDLGESHGAQLVQSKDKMLPRGFLFESIRTDIASQTLSAVPAGLESVLITDIERASALHLPVVYVLGLNDGVLPKRAHSTGLLQDEERIQFAHLFGQRLGDTAADRQLAEQSRVYMTLTRATETLTLCYPMASADGKELRASSVVARVQALFHPDSLESMWFADGSLRDVRDTIWTPATALQWLLGALREIRHGAPVPAGTSALYRYLATHSGYSEKLSQALRGLFQRAFAERLTPADAMGLFGSPMRVNVYQLETYASCAYKHFVQYGLRLAEPAERDATRAERGTLIHAALAEFVVRLREQPDVWREMSDDDARASMQGVFQALLEEPQFELWSRSRIRAEQAEEAQQVASRAAVVLTRHARFSRFLPTHLEVAFGTSDEGAYPAHTLTLRDGTSVELRGRVDRIDVANEGGEHRFRIIDYKSRALDIELYKIYHGLRLQLPVYSAVVKALANEIFEEKSKAAGFFYLPLVRKMETTNLPQDDEKALEKALTRMRAKGLWKDDGISLRWMDARLPDAVNSELFPKMYKQDGTITKNAPVLSEADWGRMEDFVMDKVAELATGIRRGEIQIAPYALNRQDIACRTCSFSAICQFDSRWDHSPLRPLDKLEKDVVLAKWEEKRSPHGTNEGDAE